MLSHIIAVFLTVYFISFFIPQLKMQSPDPGALPVIVAGLLELIFMNALARLLLAVVAGLVYFLVA